MQILWKSRKGYAPAGRLYSTFRSNLSKNFNFGGPTPLSLHRWGEMWHGGGDLHAKFHPHRCNVSPLRGEKPQNRPLSKLNTGSFALRAMLPVINNDKYTWIILLTITSWISRGTVTTVYRGGQIYIVFHKNVAMNLCQCHVFYATQRISCWCTIFSRFCVQEITKIV